MGSATVSLHALSCGHFTLPEYQFISPVPKDARKTVPSLGFLIQHTNPIDGKLTRIVFDLGVRKDLKRYIEPIQKHVTTRQPMSTDPDVVASLKRGGLEPRDVDFVVYSHVHWDHIGEPRDFPTSTFVVGHGSPALLNGTSPSLSHGSHSFFEADLLPEGRTIELSDPSTPAPTRPPPSMYPNHPADSPSSQFKPSHPGTLNWNAPWLPYGHLTETLDVFGDGSLRIVNAPGHLPGHINILARVSSSSSSDGDGDRYAYLGGDACHDRRLLTGEKEIGEWEDAHGRTCCIHVDRKAAEETIRRIRILEESGVEVIFAHDDGWEEKNPGRFFGADEGE